MSLSLPLGRVRSAVARRVKPGALAVPLALLGATVLAYGLWVPWLGLFGNDWAYLWYYHVLGPSGPGIFAAIDRPLSGGFYAVSTALLGETALPYHLFLLALRWVSSWLWWWVLLRVWPERRAGAVLAAVLMAVYPGFRQNPIAVEFILHFAVLDLFLVSLAGSLLTLSAAPGRWWLPVLLAAGGAAGMFWLEYFVGLEILRPVLLWAAATRLGLRGADRWRSFVKGWLPAALVTAGFLFWRVFVFQFPTYGPDLLDEFAAHPLQGLAVLGERVLNGLYVALPGAWGQVLALPAGRVMRLAALALVGASFGGLLWFLGRQGRAADEAETAWGEQAVGLGLLAILGGGAPFWLMGIPVTLEFPWDRPTLALMPGASLVAAGLLVMLVTRRYRLIVAAGLVSLAIGLHFQNGDVYREEWKKLQSFTWQLAWRAPGLRPGTLLLFDSIPLNRYSDNDLTAVLNWTYSPDLRSLEIPYRYFDLALRLDEEHPGLPGLEAGLPVEHEQRGTFFRGSTGQVLVLDYQPPACLKLLGPEDADWPGLTERLQRVMPLSNLDWVTGGNAAPPAVLGPEPERGWCYFFQKAELAVQRQDWPAVVSLWEQAQARGLRPAAAVELLPFVAGHARAGLWEQAEALAFEAARSEAARPPLCRLWRALPEQAGGVPGEFGCPEP